jgi:acyl phosphate:glycerol-3-phosphate acyltransferase
MLLTTAPLLVAYLLGSVSFAWVAGWIKGVELRQHGSGNLGATNAGRVLGGRWFVIVFCCDVLKGLTPVLALRLALPPTWSLIDIPLLAVLTGLAAVLGHVFTCFHGFKGGKAVATSLGVLVGLVPVVAAMCAGLWLLVWLGAKKLAGLGSSSAVAPASVLAALAAGPAQLLLSGDPWGADVPVSVLVLVLSLLIVLRHRSNIVKMIGARGAKATTVDEASS